MSLPATCPVHSVPAGQDQVASGLKSRLPLLSFLCTGNSSADLPKLEGGRELWQGKWDQFPGKPLISVLSVEPCMDAKDDFPVFQSTPELFLFSSICTPLVIWLHCDIFMTEKESISLLFTTCSWFGSAGSPVTLNVYLSAYLFPLSENPRGILIFATSGAEGWKSRVRSLDSNPTLVNFISEHTYFPSFFLQKTCPKLSKPLMS